MYFLLVNNVISIDIFVNELDERLITTIRFSFEIIKPIPTLISN